MKAVAASEDVAFIDRVLESWAAWARTSGMPSCSRPGSQYSTGHDSLPSVLMLSDDQFSAVDRAVARLRNDRSLIIEIQYRRPENEPKRRKATLCGISLREYESLLLAAQLDVLDALQPDVYGWQTL